MRTWASSADYLTGLSAECEVLANEATERFGDLTAHQLGWRPEPGRWSVAECLDHLLTTHSLYLESIGRTLARPHPRSNPEAAFTSGCFGGWFIRSLGPDSTMRMKSPGMFKPADLSTVEPEAYEGVVRRFAEQQRQTMSVIEECRAVDLRRAKVVSPASRLIRLRLGDALRLMVEHNKRHLKQAGTVMSAAEFPR